MAVRRLAGCFGLLVGLALLAAGPAEGQGPEASDRFAEASPHLDPAVGSAGRAFFVSALVPGGGQWLLGQGRWVPYLAVESWAWLQYRSRYQTGRQLARRYRELARQVPRRISPGPRPDGPFEYYEAMSKYSASGAFDADPWEPGVQPEQNPNTYNGMIWKLARDMFLPAGSGPPDPDSPEYQLALQYYMERATPQEYAWSWGEHRLEQQAFADLIRQSDEAFRSATMALGLILANHLVSAVDAFVTARLRSAREGLAPVEIESGLDPQGGTLRWTASVRVPLPQR